MTSSAPIYALTGDAHTRAEAQAWAQFASARDSSEFCASWLAILCTQIARVKGGVVLVGPDDGGSYSTAAVWPAAGADMQYLGPTAERVLRERRGIVVAGEAASPARQGSERASQVGYPIDVDGGLRGAVVLDLLPRSEAEAQSSLRLLHWASAWLVDSFRQQALGEQRLQIGRLSLACATVATALQERRFDASALGVVNELATRLQCTRVSLGWERDDSIELQAISHTASFDRRSDLATRIADAMDEVFDLGIAIVHPPLDADASLGCAHRELAAHEQVAHFCSVPLTDGRQSVGVLTFEREQGLPFDADALRVCEAVGQLIGPVLALKRQAERGLGRSLRDSVRSAARALFGPRHPALKLATLLVCTVVLVLSFADGTYRVAAKTLIEGAVQRAAVAPFEGFIDESRVRAGDTVRKNQVLARLDDRSLQLERVRWASEAEQAQRKFRQASAAVDRVAMALALAQFDQITAQLALVDDKLTRATLVAPFDGIVVSGDLSQLLGSPVEQGKVLFEVAPLDAYRVVVNVDERDIAEVAPGQVGQLSLSGLPREILAFTVRRVTPIASAQDGRNFFRVEAELAEPSPRLRPGMEGIGKITVGERRLLWIWTHPLIDWLRLWSWRWSP